ncbi:hypothetical protein R1flu_027238 [Riccia fluitans]|uniref:Glycylpeptide N-tetradecanoyltransferase n=1 Tax=Riccia fluitans TaxID=41844 RepID=A0ABD1XIR7_9MARC
MTGKKPAGKVPAAGVRQSNGSGSDRGGGSPVSSSTGEPTTAAASSSTSESISGENANNNIEQGRELTSQFGKLELSQLGKDVENLSKRAQKQMAVEKRHLFWETQPVGQFKDRNNQDVAEGSIEPSGDLASVRQEPYNLPSTYEWSTCDINDENTMKEIYTLLTNNYVEDDDNMFRFDYSVEFLRWALKPPGYFSDWHIGVRAKGSKKLVALITGVPAKIRVRDQVILMAEINFLCVHKKLRSKRLAPVLIREVTRRVHLKDIWHAAYTAGVVIPTPICTCQYWHRSLNPKKLIDVGFSRLAPRMTMSRTIKLYRLPEETSTPGFRPMERRDVPAVTHLLQNYLAQFQVAPVLTEEDIEYLLLPIMNVVNSYVVENPASHEITDFCSFYTLPSTIIGNDNYSLLKAAYSYYNVATSVPLLSLMSDALIMAKRHDYDVFNALDIMHNEPFLKDLKFGPGDAHKWELSTSAIRLGRNVAGDGESTSGFFLGIRHTTCLCHRAEPSFSPPFL